MFDRGNALRDLRNLRLRRVRVGGTVPARDHRRELRDLRNLRRGSEESFSWDLVSATLIIDQFPFSLYKSL